MRRFYVLAAALLLLTACVKTMIGGEVGGGADTGNSPASGGNTVTLSGTVVDGGSTEGARVCLDVNKSYTCDSSDPRATTNANGAWQMAIDKTVYPEYATYPLLAVVYVPSTSYVAHNTNDVDENKASLSSQAAITYTLFAPPGKYNINPITTLVYEKMLADLTLAQAENSVATTLGLGDSNSGLSAAVYGNVMDNNACSSDLCTGKIRKTVRVLGLVMAREQSLLRPYAYSTAALSGAPQAASHNLVADSTTLNAIRAVYRDALNKRLSGVQTKVADVSGQDLLPKLRELIWNTSFFTYIDSTDFPKSDIVAELSAGESEGTKDNPSTTVSLDKTDRLSNPKRGLYRITSPGAFTQTNWQGWQWVARHCSYGAAKANGAYPDCDSGATTVTMPIQLYRYNGELKPAPMATTSYSLFRVDFPANNATPTQFVGKQMQNEWLRSYGLDSFSSVISNKEYFANNSTKKLDGVLTLKSREISIAGKSISNYFPQASFKSGATFDTGSKLHNVIFTMKESKTPIFENALISNFNNVDTTLSVQSFIYRTAYNAKGVFADPKEYFYIKITAVDQGSIDNSDALQGTASITCNNSNICGTKSWDKNNGRNIRWRVETVGGKDIFRLTNIPLFIQQMIMSQNPTTGVDSYRDMLPFYGDGVAAGNLQYDLAFGLAKDITGVNKSGWVRGIWPIGSGIPYTGKTTSELTECGGWKYLLDTADQGYTKNTYSQVTCDWYLPATWGQYWFNAIAMFGTDLSSNLPSGGIYGKLAQ